MFNQILKVLKNCEGKVEKEQARKIQERMDFLMKKIGKLLDEEKANVYEVADIATELLQRSMGQMAHTIKKHEDERRELIINQRKAEMEFKEVKE